jgi:hypothetical protein
MGGAGKIFNTGKSYPPGRRVDGRVEGQRDPELDAGCLEAPDRCAHDAGASEYAATGGHQVDVNVRARQQPRIGPNASTDVGDLGDEHLGSRA